MIDSEALFMALLYQRMEEAKSILIFAFINQWACVFYQDAFKTC